MSAPGARLWDDERSMKPGSVRGPALPGGRSESLLRADWASRAVTFGGTLQCRLLAEFRRRRPHKSAWIRRKIAYFADVDPARSARLYRGVSKGSWARFPPAR